MLFNIYSLTKVHFKMCYCRLSFKAFVFKYKIFSEQNNEFFDLGFYTMCSFRDTKSNILSAKMHCYVISQQKRSQVCPKMLYIGTFPKKDDL